MVDMSPVSVAQSVYLRSLVLVTLLFAPNTILISISG